MWKPNPLPRRETSVLLHRRRRQAVLHVTVLAALLAMVGASRSALAATCTWNGTAPTFSTGSGWNCGGGTSNGPPGSADTAQFSSTSSNNCAINSSVSITQISLNTGYGGTVTASASVMLRGGLGVSSGTFTSGASAITIGGDLTIGGGTFNASSGTTTIGGAFTKTGGTFNANGGTVLFNSNTTTSHTFGGATLADVTVGLNATNGLVDGLVGDWHLDDTGSPAVDSSSSGNNGTWSSGVSRVTTGLPPVSGDVSALSFNGTSGYVTLGLKNLPANNAAQSLAVWFKGTPDSTNHNMIAMSGSGSAVQLGYRGSNLLAWASGGGPLVSTTAPTDGLWHHVAYTYDGTTDRIYLDGSLSASATSTHQTATPTSAYLGTYNAGGELWSGSLDEARIYTRALSAYEVSLLAMGSASSIAAGTHTFSDAFTCTGDFNVLAGTVTGSNTLSVGGNWSNGGTYSDTGTVTLTGTSASGSITTGGAAFGALTINGDGGTYTLQSPLTTTGALTLTAGTLAASSYAINVGGSLSITSGSFAGGAGSVSIASNLTMTGGSYTGGSGSATVGGSVNVTGGVNGGDDPTLVGYWPLDETSSPAVDSSGNGNSLTWNGSPTATTSHPSAITFSDSHSLAMTGSQYATTGNLSGISALRPATITISAWYKTTSIDSSGSEIASGSNTYGLRLTAAGITVMKRITDNTAQADWIEYRLPLTGHLDGNWHQIVGVISTGTGGAITAYLDGAVAAGSYWVNGIGGAHELSASTSPTDSAAASDPIDWDANTETYGLVIGNNPSTGGYHFGAGCSGTACAIDDVRIYDRALSAADVAALSHGSPPSGSTGTLTLAGSMSVSSSATVQSTGTLTLNSGSTLAVKTALTMDGTLNATNGAIQGVSGSSYAFKVGSTASAAPQLNINGLTVKNTDSNGMWINANTGAATTFTEFDNVAFSNGTGSQLLQIYAPKLYLSSSGCSFGSGTTYAVKLTGNGTGAGAGPRVLFGDATCATNDPATGLCATSEKSDDDADNNGVADHPSTNGAVVQFVRAASSDTAGTTVGFPTAAFDWNTFTYYSTYVTFHDASGGSDVIYVRDTAGNPRYSWVDPVADETITGTPQWITSGSTHYLYVSVNGASSNSGKVYRLKDTGNGSGSGSLTLDTSWATGGASSCSCTITSDLSVDTNNVYFAATTASAQKLFGLQQSNGAPISAAWPVTTPANVTTSSPTLSTVAATTTLYLGVTARLLQLAVSGTTFVQNSKPGTITGRVSFGTSFLPATNGTSRVYAGDSSGTIWAVSPTNFSGTNYLWSYGAGSAVTDSSYDGGTDTIQLGTSGGKVVVLKGAGSGTGGALLNTSYPYTLNSSDPITTAPLYTGGVLVVGTTGGKLYFLDRDTGNATAPNGVSILKVVSFGPTESISTVGFDPNNSHYMVSTSSAANDGRVYYFDLVSDPTPGYQ